MSFYSTQDLNHDCFFYTYPFKEDIQNARRMAQEHDLNWFSLQDPDVAEYDKNPYYKFFDRINHLNRFPATTSPSFIGWELLNQFPG